MSMNPEMDASLMRPEVSAGDATRHDTAGIAPNSLGSEECAATTRKTLDGAVELSLCMIARDSAATLGVCLESIRPWVDEMVVVDTGSVDETTQIAQRCGARLFHFPWCDSFSAARNESLRHARGRWLLWMDSDDTLPPEVGRRLREFLRRSIDEDILGCVMQVRCPGPAVHGHVDVTVVDHVKLVRNVPGMGFDGRIHEQVLPAIRSLGGRVQWTDLHVVHSGADHTVSGKARKLRRDLRLLELELAERPNHPFTLFNLGMTCSEMRDYQRAAEYLQASIRHAGAGDSHLCKAYALLVQSLAALKRTAEAWKVCEEGLAAVPGDQELYFRRGMLAFESGQLALAEESYLAALEPPPERVFSSIDDGVIGHKARHNLALVYHEQERWEEAAAQWREAAANKPSFRLAWRGLGDMLLRLQRWPQFEELVRELADRDDLRAEAELLQARRCLVNHDVPTAKVHFLRARAEPSADEEPLRGLGELLFQHGPLEEAQQTLQELAQVYPDDAPTMHNLGTVHLRLGQLQAAISAYHRALTLRPEWPATFFYLGCALHDSGKRLEAVRAWREVLRLDPNSQPARDMIDRVGAA